MAIFTSITASLAAVGTWFATLGPLQQFAVRFIVGVGLNFLASKLLGREPDQPERRAVGFKGSVGTGSEVPRAFGVGFYAPTPSLVYHTTWGETEIDDVDIPNAYYTVVYALSDLPVKGLSRLWIDGQECTIDYANADEPGFRIFEYAFDKDDNAINPDQTFSTASSRRRYAWIKFYDGTQTTADTFLDSVGHGDWGSSHIGFGVAYAILTFKWSRKHFQGFPRVTFELEGIPLLDPTTGSTGTSADHVIPVQIYNLLKGIEYDGRLFYGPQIQSDSRLVLSEWTDAINRGKAAVPGGADMTDAQRLKAFGSTTVPPRFRGGMEISIDESLANVIQELVLGSNGMLSELGDRYRLRFFSETYDPVATIVDSDIVTDHPQSFNPFFRLAETINGLQAVHPDRDQAWEAADAPAQYFGNYELDDGDRRLVRSVDMRAVWSREQVQRIMTEYVKQARRMRTHQLVLPSKYWGLEPDDYILWTSERNGYELKKFRIESVDYMLNGDITVSVLEYDPTDYDWSSDLDFVEPTVGTISPLPNYNPVLADWQAFGITLPREGGVGKRAAIALRWAPKESSQGVAWQIRHKETGLAITTGTITDPTANGVNISEGILPETIYQVRGRHLGVDTWTIWLDVLTPVVEGIVYGELELAVRNRIDEAFETASEAAADLAEYGDAFILRAVNVNGKFYLRYYTLDGVEVPGDIVLHGDVALADDSVTAPKANFNSLAALNIQVVRADLVNAIIDDAKIANAAIKTAKIDDLQLTTGKLSFNAVNDWQEWSGSTSGVVTLSFGGLSSAYMAMAFAMFSIAGNNTLGGVHITRNGTTLAYEFDRTAGDATTTRRTLSGMLPCIAGTNSFQFDPNPSTNLIRASVVVVKR